MIICPNCGCTNDNQSQYCRKCGTAISNVFSPPKVKIPIINSANKEIIGDKREIRNDLKPIQRVSPKQKEQNNIWTPDVSSNDKYDFNLREIPKIAEIDEPSIKKGGPTSILQEIPPQPFSLQSIPLTNSKKQSSQVQNIQPPKREEISSAMTSAMQALSKNLTTKKKPMRTSQESLETQQDTKYEEISSNNLDEILRNISRLDKNIEASAIINPDGVILSSALSGRVNDSLFVSIGKTLSVLGNDIVNALNTGALKSVTINGTHGKFSLAPIVSDVLLLILSGPRVKAGIIHLAVSLFKKKFKSYSEKKK